MKKFYFIFPALAILAIILVKLPLQWFAVGMATVLALVAWQLYADRLRAAVNRTEVLEANLDDLHQRLEAMVTREERARREIENIRTEKQQLLSVISHEVRTPMNGIVGSTLLLEESSLAPEQREQLATIRQCSENLMTTVNAILVNDVIAISKMQQTGEKLDYVTFELRNLVEEVLNLFADRACASHIELLYTIDPQAPAEMIGDEQRIRQVLINLVENAVKYTQEGEVVISVNYYRALSSIDYPQLRFEVRDTGTGMSATQLKNVMAGLVVNRDKSKPEEQGGLGLAICRKLAQMMGGGIEAISEQNLGSTFIFHLPITPSMKSDRRSEQEEGWKPIEGKKLLVVSYSQSRRAILESSLNNWKIQTLTSGTAAEALQLAETNADIDVVLLDLCLPDQDGPSLAVAIKSRLPKASILGMRYKADDRFTLDPALFAGQIFKPVRQQELRQQILQAIQPPGPSNDISSFAANHPFRILLVEDNAINQKIGTKILSMLGYSCTIANNGKEAIDLAADENFDLILMDVQMPVMDGLEATRMLRTCLQRQPVIIAMTANVMEGDRNACIQAGMDDYMSKPIEMKELVAQLERWYRARAGSA